ncbi:MAG TPA: hypothetical protein VG318_18720 [Actinomycetota bacterium]|nr:hypothetical protein [Actinomycetota bacterium]
MKHTDERTAAVRELFIEELAEVSGGADNLVEKVMWWVRENLFTPSTMACGEEGPC